MRATGPVTPPGREVEEAPQPIAQEQANGERLSGWNSLARGYQAYKAGFSGHGRRGAVGAFMDAPEVVAQENNTPGRGEFTRAH